MSGDSALLPENNSPSVSNSIRDLGSNSSSDLENVTSEVRFEELFEFRRILEKNKLKFGFYFPFGCLLFLIRIIAYILGVVILSRLPRSSPASCKFLNGICWVLGFVIKVDDKHLDESTKMLIANHVSILDRIIVNAVVPCNIVTNRFHMDKNSFFCWRDADLNLFKDPTFYELLALQKSVEESSIPSVHFPECATTNGKVGLLKFQNPVFLLNHAVQPILIQISPSFVNVHPSFLGSSVWSDIFWTFFCPSTLITLKILPTVDKGLNDDSNKFSKKVQRIMSNASGLKPTLYTWSDKAELIKRLKTSVSMKVKKLDGGSTASVCKSNPSEENLDLLLSKHSRDKLSLNTAAKKFGQSPTERMLSYKERKVLLIAAAKQKYFEKMHQNTPILLQTT